jgi:hypothetical protein
MATNWDDGISRFDSGFDFWDEVTPLPAAPLVGSRADMFNRLKALIPRSWFQASPNFDATLQGGAWALSSAYAQITYAALQTRIKTATDGFLDLISYDFFGTSLPRLTLEPDVAFRSRILANLFVRGPTRADMAKVLTLLTGTPPAIFEPGNTTDSGGWDGRFYWDADAAQAGGWGDSLPYQSFVTAYRPFGNLISLGELDTYRFAFDTNAYWSDNPPSALTDAAIIAAVEATRAIGTIVWLRIADAPVFP